MAKRVYCYIDGFNFYYRLFRNKHRRRSLKRFKWLNLRELCGILAGSGRTVEEIYYFTAAISPSPHDPEQHLRQQTYWRALDTTNVTRIEGQFRPRTKKGYPKNPAYGNLSIEVETFEEKGSDVNLAVCLVRDALLNRFDEAIVISNDSDLALAINTAVVDGGKRVRVISPDLFVVNKLQAAVYNPQTDTGIIEPRILSRCQFPTPVIPRKGKPIHKPRKW